MSEDLATLGIKIDATQARVAALELDNLSNKGGKAEQSVANLTLATDLLKKAMAGLGLTLGVIKIAELVKDAALLSARFETMGVVMRVAGANAGYTAGQMASFQKVLEATGISMLESRETITKLATANLDLTKASKLAREAQDLAVVAGINSSEAFARVTDGIISGRTEILKTIGLNVSFEASYQRLAATLGKQASQLTEGEKLQARFNAVLQEGTAYAGLYEEAMGTAGKQITSLQRYWENFKIEVGDVLLPALTDAVFGLSEALKSANAELLKSGSRETVASIGEGLATAFHYVYETVVIVGANIAYVIKETLQDLQYLGKVGYAVMHGNFGEAAKLAQDAQDRAIADRKALDAFADKIINGKGGTGFVPPVVTEQNKQDQADAKQSIEDYRIAMGKIARAQKEIQDAASEAAKEQIADFKKLSNEADNYIKSLVRETGTIGQTAIAAKEFEINLAASVAPTDELRDKIYELGDAVIFALGNEAVTKNMDEFLKKIEATTVASLHMKTVLGADGSIKNNPNAIGGILSIKTGQEQGTGDGVGQRFDQEKFDVKAANAYLDILRQIDQETKTAAASMAASFGSVGKAVGDLSSVMSTHSVQMQTIEAKRKSYAERGISSAQANAEATKESAQAELQYSGDVLGAAKSLFSEKTAIYKGLQVAETVYRGIQLAGAIQQIATDATTTASTVAAAGTQASSWGVVAIARQFADLPWYLAIPAAAAVAAVLAGLGVALGGSGGKSTPGATDAVDRQKAAGAGSVLGDVSQKSNSVAKSIEAASKNSNDMLEYTSVMATALKSIDSNIGSLTNLLARNLGVSGGSFDTSKLGLGTSKSPTSFLFDPLSALLGTSSKHTTTSLQDFGLSFKSQTLGSIADGILGNVYQQVLKSTSTNFLGIKISSSSSTSTANSALSSALAIQFVKVIDSLKAGVVAAAGALGVQGASSALDSFQVALGTLSFKDLTGAQIQDELKSVFGKLGDDLAASLIPGLSDFQNAGEGAFETLVRLAREYQVVDVTMASIGKTFDLVGVSSLSARDNLVSLAGGLDAFTGQAKFFADNFLTPAQQLAPIIKAVGTEMTRLGQTGVATKEQFANLVQSIDVSTQSGALLYSALMKVAPAFAKVADAATEAFNAIVSNTTTALDKLITASQSAATAARSSADAYKQASKSIADTVTNLRGGTGATGLAISRARFSAGLAGAQSGNLQALNDLPKLAQDFAAASKAGSATQRAYNNDLNSIVSGLMDAGLTADNFGAIADYQAKLYDVQTDILTATKANLTQTNVNADLLAQQITQLGVVGNLIAQFGSGTIDSVTAGNNIQTVSQYLSVKDGTTLSSVLTSLGAIAASVQAQLAVTAALIQSNAERAVADAAVASAATVQAAAVATIAAAPTQMTALQAALSLGPIDKIGMGHNTKLMDVQGAILKGIHITAAQWAQAGVAPIPGFAKGGDFGGGMRFVGEQGIELERTGPSKITSNNDLKKIFSNDDVVAELKRVREELTDIKKQQRVMSDIWQRTTRGGETMRTTVVP